MLSVIIPAANEEAWIGPCLRALFAAPAPPGGAEVIVVANGCTDGTAAAARALAPLAAGQGWGFQVLVLARGGKPGALNAGDAAASPGSARAYLDADVRVSPGLMAGLSAAVAGPGAVFASGTPVIPPARSAVSRAYARFWLRLPFNRSAAPGYGVYAVSRAGRARWGTFPQIIADDSFARLHFMPAERLQLDHPYDWPVVEGLAALVRVRRRQDAGMAEINRLYPGLRAGEGRQRLSPPALARLALTDPLGLAAYATVIAATRLRRNQGWTRGR